MSLAALTPREASIFACLCDTVVAPEPVLPPVRDTGAVAFFDYWLSHAPKANRLGLRALLYGVELSPRLLGMRDRLRRLGPDERARALESAEAKKNPQVRALVKLIEGMVFLSYYGDDGVMGRLGYDAEANLARARDVRVKEARP